MEKENELSWNFSKFIQDVVIDETFQCPKGYGWQSAPSFDTKGKNFDRYDFVYIKVAFVGYNSKVTKFDRPDGGAIGLNYGEKDPPHNYITDTKTVSGQTVTISASGFLDNPPPGWSEETEGKAKAEVIALNANWAGLYTYYPSGYAPQIGSAGFDAYLTWYNGKVYAGAYNYSDRYDSVTVRVTITGYIGATHN